MDLLRQSSGLLKTIATTTSSTATFLNREPTSSVDTTPKELMTFFTYAPYGDGGRVDLQFEGDPRILPSVRRERSRERDRSRDYEEDCIIIAYAYGVKGRFVPNIGDSGERDGDSEGVGGGGMVLG
ncbi:hypothetical protein E3N88_30990 [Mikania micrantha]|uniref:Uncharacterized protein n=1 Tax=Mikania micrantha TaxID=192012 RepID=A0A5N6MP14_9ASTR|nr:hypothetical protein E3N88_30990 [Mikania micrantha]